MLRKRSETTSRLPVDQEVGGSSPPSCTKTWLPKLADDVRSVDYDDVPATGREVEGKPASQAPFRRSK